MCLTCVFYQQKECMKIPGAEFSGWHFVEMETKVYRHKIPVSAVSVASVVFTVSVEIPTFENMFHTKAWRPSLHK